MSSLQRLLSVLDVYSEETPVWTIEQLRTHLGFTKSTIYRYVRELCDSGLLTPVGRGSYGLGPRIIELDRQIRVCDPLLTVGRAVLAAMKTQCGEGLLMICSLYVDNVLCVHHQENPNDLSISYVRGRPMPLFQGSASKAILAHLPERRLMKLFLYHRRAIAAAGLGNDWEVFKTRLREIGAQTCCVTHGEIDAGVFAISCPIFDSDRNVLASVTLALPERRATGDDIDFLTGLVVDGARRISDGIFNLVRQTGRPGDGAATIVPIAAAKRRARRPAG
jgi:DNA-binding IclR family transcriptional regulator